MSSNNLSRTIIAPSMDQNNPNPNPDYDYYGPTLQKRRVCLLQNQQMQIIEQIQSH